MQTAAKHGRHHRGPTDRQGRSAQRPGDIPAPGWTAIARRAVRQISEDNISIVAAGVAFYAFLSIFPAIAAAFAIYGLVMSPSDVAQQMSQVAGYLPAQAQDLVASRLQSLARNPQETLGWGAALSIVLGLWTANKGTKALFTGINIAYNEADKRNFLVKNVLTLLFTFGGIVFGLMCIALLMVFPAVAAGLGLPPLIETAIDWLRWPLLAAGVLLAFAVLYRYAPNRERPRFRWVTWGAAAGVVLWLLGSWALSFYVSNFGDYDKTYGSIAAVVVLLLWLYVSSFVVLLGAEINSESELQTARDSTTGEAEPMGRRGAYHADHVAD